MFVRTTSGIQEGEPTDRAGALGRFESRVAAELFGGVPKMRLKGDGGGVFVESARSNARDASSILWRADDAIQPAAAKQS